MTEIERLQESANQINSDFQAIRSAIVDSGVEVADGTRTAEYGAKVREIYEKSKQDEYDAFWDAVQDYGNRDYFPYGFAGPGWGAYAEMLAARGEAFKPKYPIKFKSSSYSCIGLFYYFNRKANSEAGELIDFTEFCKKADFSQVTGANYAFDSARGRNITVDFSNATSLNYTFALSNGGNTSNIFIKVSEKCTNLSYTFAYNVYMQKLTFMEGSVIAGNIDVHWSQWLNKASIISIMTHLSDTTSGKIATFAKDAVNRAFATSSGANDGSTSAEWTALKATKPNWTFSLV